MELFLDTANLQSIKKLAAMGIIDGVTTNPSHLSTEGGDPKKLVLEICAALKDGIISVEVTEQEAEAVYKQAKEIAKLAPNIAVKIPCHKDYYAVIDRLVKEGVRLNITLVFTLIQGLMMCKLGVAYISPFVGRWDDIDVDGIDLLIELRQMVDTYDYQTKILAASLRHIRHFHQAILAGADVATLPPEAMLKALDHPLTDQGIAKFNADWQKLGVRSFP